MPCWITYRKKILSFFARHLHVRTENRAVMPHVSLLPFFYTDGLRYSSLIYQTQKVSRVSSTQRSVWVPGALRFQKPQCNAFNGKFVSFPLTLLHPCMDSPIACKGAKVGQQGEGAASHRALPQALGGLLPTRFSSQTRQGADTHSSLAALSLSPKLLWLPTVSQRDRHTKEMEVDRTSGPA